MGCYTEHTHALCQDAELGALSSSTWMKERAAFQPEQLAAQ